MIVKGGSTDVVAYFQMRLTAGGDGTGLTISDFDLTYTRSGDTPAAKADAVALAAANTAHTDNRGIEVDPTDAPGLYRFDFPDAAFAASVREVILTVKHASCFTESLRVEIDPFGAPAGASLAADIAAVKTETAAILDDTDLIDDATSGLAKIATDVAAVLVDTGTTLDDVVDAIKVQTDKLTFTVANQIDANIQYVNDVAVTGDGQSGTEWGPA